MTEELNMQSRRHAPHLILVLAVLLILPVVLAGCWAASPTTVSPAGKSAAPESGAAAKATVPASFPATWTPTPIPVGRLSSTAVTPTPTRNYPETLIAQTTIASGVRCKRAPDSWRISSFPSTAHAGWCDILGAQGTIYEYRLVSPDNWMVTTFGDTHPNLAFATGIRNVHVRLYQAYSYRTRNWEGPLEDAPEKAYRCDENERCLGFISPHETIIRQQTVKSGDRDILVLDSTAGDLNIRRYYQNLPFKAKKHESMRLFILEFTWLDSALEGEEFDRVVDKIDTINRSLWQR
jgi:hypothetical protein